MNGNAIGGKPIRLRLLSRKGCHLCDQMRQEADALLADRPREWEIVDVDLDPALAQRYGEVLPVLFVNGVLFARVRLPRLASRLRLQRAAERFGRPEKG
jgi:glutaredoxin-like protein DUF836